MARAVRGCRIDLSQAVLDVAELHALEGKVAANTGWFPRNDWRKNSGRLRFGDLHGMLEHVPIRLPASRRWRHW